MARPHFTTVRAYIASKPKDARVALEQVRRAIRTAVPDAEERLSRVPSFVRGMVKKIYRDYAAERGIAEITPAT